MVMTGAPMATSATVRLNFCYRGDFGSRNEYLNIFDEDGNSVAQDCGSVECSPVFQKAVLLVPRAVWDGWAADGIVTFTAEDTKGKIDVCTPNAAVYFYMEDFS